MIMATATAINSMGRMAEACLCGGLYDDSIGMGSGANRLRPRDGRADGIPIGSVGWDGAFSVPLQPGSFMTFGALPDNKQKTLNPYKRWWGKVKKVWFGPQSYTDIGRPLQLWKPVLAGYAAKWLRSIETVPEERHGIAQDIIGGFVTMLRTSLEQYQHSMPYKVVPALRRHLSAAEGPSNVQHVYTYYNGSSRECALYLSTGDGDKPEESLLRKGIEFVDAFGISPYEGHSEFRSRFGELFDKSDGPPVLEAATLYDYRSYFEQEPGKAERWAVKDDSWIAQQYGDRNLTMEAALPADLQGKVRVYCMPVSTTGFWYKIGEWLGDKTPRSGTMWREWAVKKPLLYSFGDFLLEPLEMMLERILPPETMRAIVYEKSKGISGAWRGFTNPRTPYLYYG